MRKTNLIQLTVVALLIFGLNSQATNASVYSVAPVVTEEKTTPVINTVIPAKVFNGLLPSLDGAVAGTFANYTDGDDGDLRYNEGQLLTGTSEHSFEYPEIVGPAHGLFITELYWNGSLAGDIDLYPGYINSTGHLRNGYPAGVTEDANDYYSGANPEYIYMEIDLNSTQTATLVSQVWGYDNAVIDFYVNATWINYDEYYANIGLLAAPELDILYPVDGGVYAVPDLLHDPQRYVPLNYSYVPGTESAWVSAAYDFVTQDAEASYAGGSWDVSVWIDEVDRGQTAGGYEVRLPFDVGAHNITILALYDGVVVDSTVSLFTVEGITKVGTATIAQTNTTFTISQEFADPAVDVAGQVGYEVDAVSLFYYDQGTGNAWTEVDMVETTGVWSYDILDLNNGTTVHYYFVAYDAYGVDYVFDLTEPNTALYTEGIVEPTEDTDEDDSPSFLVPLAIVSIGLMAIVRRRK